MRTLSSSYRTVSMGRRHQKIRLLGFLLLLRRCKSAAYHPADIQLALHRVLFDRSVVGDRGLLALRVDGEREVNGSAFHGSCQVGTAELSDVLASQLFAILLEGDRR